MIFKITHTIESVGSDLGESQPGGEDEFVEAESAEDVWRKLGCPDIECYWIDGQYQEDHWDQEKSRAMSFRGFEGFNTIEVTPIKVRKL